MNHPATNRRAFTLIELLVVLIILSALALVAVRTTEGLQDQARYEATQRGLEEIREAVLGPAGFVAHMGRLPLATTTYNGLGELFESPGFGFNVVSPAEDAEVKIGTGWNGPYLRLGLGESSADGPHDGWGKTYLLRRADDSAAATAQPIEQVWAAGTNHPTVSDADVGYDADLRIKFYRAVVGSTFAPTTEALNEIAAGLTGTVYEYDSGNNLATPTVPAGSSLVVRCYGPNGSGLAVSLGTSSVDATTGNFTIAGATIGPRVVRAYLYPNLTGMGTPTKQSAPIRLVLQRGINEVPRLVLKPVS